jgi:class 3 adenylate cyclase
LFAVPILFSTFAGLIGVILLLNRRPEMAETVRVLAMAASVPFFIAGFVVSINAAAICVVIGEIIFMIGAVHYHVMQGQRGQFMSRFLSPQVARLVSERGLGSAMHENNLEITVVSCDLRGFTAYAQANSSSKVLQVLREYYDAVGRIVGDFGATIKDFAGDGILILVGAPLPMDHHARCGLEMARRIRVVGVELTRRWSTEQNKLGIGIGVASGLVTVGVIGSSSRLEYTAVGSAVNLSCRLCEQAQASEILVDRRTVELAGEAGLEPRSPIEVKGFGSEVPNYTLTAA